MYYWDSYFTMLGLVQSGRTDLVKNMLDNFAYLITKIAHIPNGNRTYYLPRSRPPYFAAMDELYASASDCRERLGLFESLDARSQRSAHARDDRADSRRSQQSFVQRRAHDRGAARVPPRGR